MLPARAGELMVGALLVFVTPRLEAFARRSGQAASWVAEASAAVGFASIAYALWWFDDATLFPGLNALIPCVGAALLMQVRTRFTLFGYPGLAMILFLLAAFCGFALVLSILLNDDWRVWRNRPPRQGR